MKVTHLFPGLSIGIVSGIGFAIRGEGLHAVKNLSDMEILAYRVEFKQ
jgi:hypothetical protein